MNAKRADERFVVVCVNDEFLSELGDDREYESVDELAMDILGSGFPLPKAGLKKGRDYDVVPSSARVAEIGELFWEF